MCDPTTDLLQALEHAAEEIRRLSLVLRQVLEAQQRGERLSDARVAQYLEHSLAPTRVRSGWAETIRVFRAVIGKDQAH